MALLLKYEHNMEANNALLHPLYVTGFQNKASSNILLLSILPTIKVFCHWTPDFILCNTKSGYAMLKNASTQVKVYDSSQYFHGATLQKSRKGCVFVCTGPLLLTFRR